MSGLFGGSRRPKSNVNEQSQILAQSRLTQAAENGLTGETNMSGYTEPKRLKASGRATGVAQGGSFGAGGKGAGGAISSSTLGAVGRRNTFLGA